MRGNTFLGFVIIGGFCLAAVIVYFFLSSPSSVDISDLKLSTADPVNGKYVYWAAGCNGCHLAEGKPKKYYLAGGQKFQTNYGTFIAPNISNSKTYGIGKWDFKSFYGAVKFGQSPDGEHYFPSTRARLPSFLKSAWFLSANRRAFLLSGCGSACCERRKL